MSTQFYAYKAECGKALTLFTRQAGGLSWEYAKPDQLYEFISSGWETITIVSEYGLPIGTDIIDNHPEDADA